MAGSGDSQNSINLNLRFCRRFRCSNESFYMGFDCGVDSDIEEIGTGLESGQDNEDTTVGQWPVTLETDRSCVMSEECMNERKTVEGKYRGLSIAEWARNPPSDRLPVFSETIMSPEDSLSFTSNSSKPDSLQSINMPERKQDVADAYSEKPEDFPSPEDCLVKISEDSELEKTNDIQISPKKQTGTLTIELNQMALSCNSSLQGSYASLPNKLTSEKNMRCNWQNEGDGLLKMLSAVYAKLLVVMGVCFPLGEVISHRIPVSYYEGFYLYLYFGSIAFLFYVYIFLLRHQKTVEKSKSGQPTTFCQIFAKKIVPFYRHSSWRLSMKSNTSSIKVSEGRHCGSFYLRLGAVAFGVGSMIYSGLEFGQFFELKRKSHCYNILYGLTPSIRMAFTFIQLYFIFLNSRVAIKKFKTLARFGLMHMIATNMCVWLHVLVAETKHEIMTNINHNLTQDVQSLVLQDEVMDYRRMNVEQYIHSRRKERSIEHEIYISHDCRRANIMGKLVQDVSPFLFPCTIEYSLICAAILYVMWKNIGKINNNTETASSGSYSSRNRHQYTVDCTKANKGLFSGIIILVSAIISLIIFFVLIKKEMYKNLAVMEAHVFELALYILSSIGVIIALIQVKKLKYNPYRNIELDNILLIVAQSGLYVFTMFSIIGGHFTMDQNTVLALLTAVACLIQATLQTIFILNASRRYCKNSNQMRKKPGREMVTFLLVCNFAMWSINTLETRRADSNPVQIHFYGFWAWTIITHVTTPLTIFFRFHSTVCLCDIWKHSYKVRPELI